MCAALFNWALGSEQVTPEQARQLASRKPGCSWEAHWQKVYELGMQ
jgi:hypothetical protein